MFSGLLYSNLIIDEKTDNWEGGTRVKVEELISALDYIEEHISGEIHVSDIADYCYVSLSALQKAFKYAFHISINDYILRRRFSCAGADLLKTEDSILDIALKYGYSNAESFTRGFQKIWGISPRDYRKSRKFSGHTPKFSIPGSNPFEEGMIMSKTKYDLTELYDVICARKNNAYVCADLNSLKWINDNLGIAAGDAALLELMRRVEEACNEEDIFLRIGGDEFVVFTNSTSMEHAEEIVAKVTAQNGSKILCGENEFPVNVHIGAFRNAERNRVNAKEMFTEIANGIEEIHK